MAGASRPGSRPAGSIGFDPGFSHISPLWPRRTVRRRSSPRPPGRRPKAITSGGKSVLTPEVGGDLSSDRCKVRIRPRKPRRAWTATTTTTVAMPAKPIAAIGIEPMPTISGPKARRENHQERWCCNQGPVCI
jgi:hypothetical protein